MGEREYTQAELQSEWEALNGRLAGADRTTSTWQKRAEEAANVARAYQEFMRKAGLLTEDASAFLKSPEQVAAERAGQQQEPEPEFKLPSILAADEDGGTDAFYSALQEAVEQKGAKYAFGLFADLIDRQLARIYRHLTEEHLPRTLDQRVGKFDSWFQSLEATNQRGDFLYAMQQVRGADGQPRYPELQPGSPQIAAVNRVLDQMAAQGMQVETPEAFEYAVAYHRYQTSQQPRPAAPAGAPPAPPRSQPPTPPVQVTEPAPSGVPRPARPGNGALSDTSKRLLSQPGVMGGMKFHD